MKRLTIISIFMIMLISSLIISSEVGAYGTPVISSIFTSNSSEVFFVGDEVFVRGSGFGDKKGNLLLIDNDRELTELISADIWSETRISFKIPEKISFLPVKANNYVLMVKTADGPVSPGAFMEISPLPIINSISPTSFKPGDRVSIKGDNFGYIFYEGSLYIDDEEIQLSTWSNNEVSFIVPNFIEESGIIKIRLPKGSGYTNFATYNYSLERVSNDPFSIYQHYISATNVDGAWKYSEGSHDVTVAIIDSGIYINHPDIKNNIWKNSKEIEGNGVDDDTNGYVDDIFGWNFSLDNNRMDIFDGDDHGTFVAGIVGAQHNNRIGIAGINKYVKLMPIIACNSISCEEDDINDAIKYAVDNGADIINISLGSVGVTDYSASYDNNIKYAYDNNVLVVAAAGNGDIEGGNGKNLGTIKASPVCNDNYDNMVLGVGALSRGSVNTRASWSNYGICVDIWAPGEEIVSATVPANNSSGAYYDYYNGTSFSAPIVTGIAALIKAKYPLITNKALRDRIIRSKGSGFIVDAEKAIKDPLSPGESISGSTSSESTNTGSKSTGRSGLTTVVSEERDLVTKVDYNLTNKLKGKILLQVESHGEAWYVNPDDGDKYYLQNGGIAYGALKKFGKGISNIDIAKIPVGVEGRFEDRDSDGDGLANQLEEGLKTDPNKADTDGDGVSDGDEVLKNNTNPLGSGNLNYSSYLANRFRGNILLQVESHGEAWYVNPDDGKRYYMKNGEAAYQIMRYLSLGISNENLRKIAVGELDE